MKTYFLSYPEKKPFAVALGNFDGVHKGHTKIINALSNSLYHKVVYTFFEHPLNILKGKGSVKVINTREEKISVMENLGVDTVIFDDFLKVKDMSPKEFVEEILVKTLNAKEVYCGYNFRFGVNAEGDTNTLVELCKKHSISVNITEMTEVDSKPVSSSQIRESLFKGDLEEAEKLLGRKFFIKSTVRHGKALGRTLGFPTVNLDFEEDRAVLSYGVYLAKVLLNDRTFPAVVNIGLRPTAEMNAETPKIEAHIIGFEGDLYGESITLEFIKKLRDEKKFDSLEELKEQVEKDIEYSKNYFHER